MTDAIQFDDGAAYEQFMGRWSQLAGDVFLHWLDSTPGRRWLDVGCGNGAFTERLAVRCTPAALHGIDPSTAQLEFARRRPLLRDAQFVEGDAMALPFATDSIDAAVMPLVIFFVPEPAQGVAEMARVVVPGGEVSAYAWDMDGGGFPYADLHAEMRALELAVPLPPHPEASSRAALASLWSAAGLVDVLTHEITVTRRYADFDEYWSHLRCGPSISRTLSAIDDVRTAALQLRMRALVTTDAAGRITASARANAVRGTVPARAQHAG